jgi:hypothetical protein
MENSLKTIDLKPSWRYSTGSQDFLQLQNNTRKIDENVFRLFHIVASTALGRKER